ncbi:hypothetical protein Tcan_01734, partial [Toxocara canis]
MMERLTATFVMQYFGLIHLFSSFQYSFLSSKSITGVLLLTLQSRLRRLHLLCSLKPQESAWLNFVAEAVPQAKIVQNQRLLIAMALRFPCRLLPTNAQIFSLKHGKTMSEVLLWMKKRRRCHRSFLKRKSRRCHQNQSLSHLE